MICFFESSTCYEQLCAHPQEDNCINPLNAELNPICHLLALLGAHHILHVSRVKVKTTSGIMGNRIPHNRPEHEQHHGYHHDTKVKPEAATAVVELLMMGVRTPETC